jgi:hypothetical protein
VKLRTTFCAGSFARLSARRARTGAHAEAPHQGSAEKEPGERRDPDPPLGQLRDRVPAEPGEPEQADADHEPGNPATQARALAPHRALAVQQVAVGVHELEAKVEARIDLQPCARRDGFAQPPQAFLGTRDRLALAEDPPGERERDGHVDGHEQT